ncbi:signal peptidase II, partial [Acidobacteria bacterium AH-259-G07]|nr:signal peptidase II [Acidobacteria bacterium AH-259-G07]
MEPETRKDMRALAIILGFVILVADLITKWWVANSGWLRHYIIIDGFLKIEYVQNEGIAFGLFHSLQSQWKPTILSVMAIVAVTIVLYYIWRTRPDQKGLLVSLGLLLGGILGNFIDRLLNHYVIDFIEVHWRDQFSWPTFNLADAAITCGVLLILYQTFVGEDNQEAG